MTDNEALRARLRRVFADEVRERIARGNACLIKLEQARNPAERQPLIEELFREAHSMKGAAAAIGMADVQAVAHSLETLLDDVRRTGEAGPGFYDAVLRALDGIDEAVQELPSTQAGSRDDTPGLSDVPEREQPAHHAVVPVPEASAGSTVRVPVHRLDALLSGFGELTEISAKLEASAKAANEMGRAAGVRRQRPQASSSTAGALAPHPEATGGSGNGAPPLARMVDRLGQSLLEDARRMKQLSETIHGQILEARLVPLSVVLDAFPRMVRDLARERGKTVELVVEGADTEVDRSVLDPLRTPLTHIVRNAIDHGLETSDERRAAGKRPEGRLIIEASTVGDHVTIAVSDDGRGIDLEALRRQLARRGVAEEGISSLSDQDLLDQVFTPGFTTSAAVTEVSGRGVGLDVVRHVVEKLYGTVGVRTSQGSGTTFELTLPLSAATLQCVSIRVRGMVYALPARNVDRAIRVRSEEIHSAHGRPVLDVDGQSCVVADAAGLIGLDESTDTPPDAWRAAVVLAAEGHRAAILVDDLLSVEETLVRPLPAPLDSSRWTSGTVMLHTGAIAVLLNPAHLLRELADAPSRIRREPVEDAPSPVIVLAEDSFTTRTMEKAILESAGYIVRAVGDGQAAWEVIEDEGCDLVVCDVNMPIMDGLALTSRLRADDRFRHLPVILVTSLDKPEDKRRGAAAGADAYITKGGFERGRLLETIRELI